MSTSYSSTLNLLKGHPNSSHLPTSLLQSSFNRLSPSSLLTSLNYGPESGPLSLKTSLAQFLSSSNPPSPNQIFITNGISHSLSLLTSTLKPKIVYTESPTYFLSRKIFEDEGAQVIDVPMKSTHGGIDIPLFSSLLSSSSSSSPSSPSPKFLYIIPTHNNPTSYTYSLSERKQLVDLCIANKIYLIADEVYHFLTFDNTKDLNERVRQVSEKEWVVGLGSFTKIWSPGIRCGWIECDSSILETIEVRRENVKGFNY
ncbi:hypothetical protein TL16_g09690 [Triparma laevis f. inornata]|uniref:Aminotransferase class I/classII large domain-containing protein n=1 Tax=Triparma laevis f. inornata TaxID=1714386 RepID=A0A9W7EMZ3_9STRA|nr:hypothetical protein TL16_g09690 [Triparma laevis f. inornata]